MSLRDGKRPDSTHRLQNHSRPMLGSSNQLPPPPLISDNQKESSCSCPPFDCICNDLLNQMQSYQQHVTNVSCNEYDTSPYQQNAEPPSNGYYNTSQNNEMFYQSCDFAPIHGDIFQPEEIFQLDQPLRPSDQSTSDNARSPTIILDLGNGSNQRDGVKFDQQGWMCRSQAVVADDNSNSCGRYLPCSPNNNYPVFQQSQMDFNKLQDCQENFGNISMKTEGNYDDRESLFMFNNDLSCEKMKNNSDINPRYMCFSSEESSMDQDCVSDLRYDLGEDTRQNVPELKTYNPIGNDCKFNGKSHSGDHELFPDVMTNHENFTGYHQPLNKVCANFDFGYDAKTVTDPLYFLDNNDIRGSCEVDNITSYLQPQQIFNSQAHYQHASN